MGIVLIFAPSESGPVTPTLKPHIAVFVRSSAITYSPVPSGLAITEMVCTAIADPRVSEDDPAAFACTGMVAFAGMNRFPWYGATKMNHVSGSFVHKLGSVSRSSNG